MNKLLRPCGGRSPRSEAARPGMDTPTRHLGARIWLMLLTFLVASQSTVIAQTYYQLNPPDVGSYVVNGVTVTVANSGGIGWGSECGDDQTRPFCLSGPAGGSWTYTFSPAISSVRLQMVMVASGLIGGGSEVAHVTINGSPYTVTSSNISGGTSPHSCSDPTVLTAVGGTIVNGSAGTIPSGVVTITPGTPITSLTIDNSGSTATVGFWNYGLFLDGPVPPAPITGTLTACAGTTTTLSDATSGGVWSSGNTSVATITGAGIVTGVAAGTATISYTVSGASATAVVTVNANPVSAITGNTTLSTAITTALTDATSGGVWSSANTSVATVNSGTGVVTGLSAGTATISYTSTISGCTTTVTTSVTVKTPNNAMNFDGANDRIDGTNASLPQGSSPRTIEAWVNLNNTSGSKVIFNWGTFSNNQRCGLLTSGISLYFVGESNDFGATSATISAGVWTHVAVTMSGQSVQFYVNGILKQSGTLPALPNTTGGSWSISNTNDDPLTREPFAGAIDEIRVWNTVRTAAQIQDNMNCDVAQQTGLVAYYRFDQGTAFGTNTITANILSDYSGNNSCGTISNMALNGSTSNYVPGAVGSCNSITLVQAISGTASLCAGATTTLSSATTGGSWSSSNGTVAAVNASTGVVTGTAAGNATITYKVCGASATAVVTVNAASAIGGTAVVCMGATTTLTNSVTGGSWTSSNSSVATIDASGVVTPVSAGVTTVSYTLAAGCYQTVEVTVNAAPPAISGTAVACAGGTMSLSNTVTGGTWTSNTTSVATINTSGVVTAASTGVATISYTLGNGCYATKIASVNLLPSVSITVTGGSVFCQGNSTTLTSFVAPAGATPFLNAPNASGPVTICDCPSGYVAVGLAGRGGSWIDQFKIVCRQLVGGVLTGSTVQTSSNGTSTGGSAQGPYTFSGNKVLVGVNVEASSSNAIDAVTGYGQDVSYVTAGSDNSVSPTALTSIAGSSSVGSIGTVYAPPGMVITGMYTYNNFHATGVAFRYTPISSFSVSGTSATWSTGTTARSISVNTSGTYSVTFTNSNGCSATASKTITVNPVAVITGASAICAGTTTILSSSLSGGTWTSSTPSVVTILSSATGLVAGVAAGTARISYTSTAGCVGTMVLTVNQTPLAITGTSVVCQGSVTTLATGTSGGSWTSTNTTVASIDAAGGVVSGLVAGTTTISYTMPTGCYRATAVTVNPVAVITGTPAACSGATTTLSSSLSGGTWASSTPSVAGIGSGSGIVNALSAGTSAISYTSTAGCVGTVAFTVNPSPSAISGTAVVCMGSFTTLTNSVSGGSWSTADGSIATIDASGVVTPVSDGITTVTYTLPAGCFSTRVLTINPLPAAITGTAAVCEGLTTTLASSTTGGTWTSNNTSVASIDATSGIVSGVLAGNATITYQLATGCNITTVATVNPSPSAISGTAVVCMGSTTTLSNSVSGGSWTSSDATIATIDASGIVTPVSDGNAIITYALPEGCFATRAFTVNPLPAAIAGTTDMCMGNATTLSSATSGGVWTSGGASIITVSSSTGIVTGHNAGITNITYTLPTGCYITTSVNNMVAAIAGSGAICSGLNVTLTDATSGGTWSTSDATVAPINISGIITAGTGGSATISYTTAAGCYRTKDFTVVTTPPSITGTLVFCVGSTTTLGNTGAGGTWSIAGTTVVAGPSTDGVLTGMTAGTTPVTYSLSPTCRTSVIVTVNAIPQVITGTDKVCPGNTTALATASTGGVWSSSNTALATVDAVTGVVTGVTSGTPIISYTFTGTGCARTAPVTVNPLVPAITGASAICAGSTITLGNSAPNGVSWSTSDPSVATVGSGNGVVSGVGAGTATITFTVGTGCIATTIVTVGSVAAITGASQVCAGSDITLSSTTTGGVWSSSNTAKATVDPATGVVTGVANGPANIYYAAGGCSAVKAISVNALPSVITGYQIACVGTTTTLSSVSNTGTWTSSNTSVATIGSTNGYVTGVAAGNTTISYTAAGTGCIRTAVVTVNPFPGAITGTAVACAGATATLSNSVTGGTWTSGGTSTATIDVATGVVTAIAQGTVTMTYAFGTNCKVIASFTVKPQPAAIAGTPSVCMPVVTTLTDATTGGAWTSSDASVATVGSAVSAGFGVVSGVSTGTVNITYTIATSGCFRTTQVTVNAGLDPGTISPSGTPRLRTISAPHTMTFTTSGVPGGVWSSSNPSIATVDPSTGLVTGVAAGNATISYTVTGACSNTAVKPMNVLAGRDGENTNVATGISLYPNPTGGSFTFETEQAGDLHIFTIDGREVASYTVAKGITQVTLPASIATGVYMVRYTATDGTTTMIRLVYEH